MSRLERFLIPIVALVIASALLLETLDASAVRTIAIVCGIALFVLLVYGMVRRARTKLNQDAAMRAMRQTSNASEPNSAG